MLIPGIVSATFKNLSIDDVIAIACRNKLSAIEWSENHHIEIGNTAQASGVKAKCLDAGISIASYGSYYRLGKAMDFQPSLENAIALGTDRIRIWAGDKPSSAVSEAEYEALVTEAKQISASAAEYGIKVCLEWHKNTLTDRNHSGLKFLRDVDCSNFRTFWQPSPEMDVKERCEGIRMVSKYIENIHVYYWDETGRRPLSEGESDWKEYMKLFGPEEHYALLEFVKDNTEEQFASDAAAFLSWLK